MIINAPRVQFTDPSNPMKPVKLGPADLFNDHKITETRHKNNRTAVIQRIFEDDVNKNAGLTVWMKVKPSRSRASRCVKDMVTSHPAGQTHLSRSAALILRRKHVRYEVTSDFIHAHLQPETRPTRFVCCARFYAQLHSLHTNGPRVGARTRI